MEKGSISRRFVDPMAFEVCSIGHSRVWLCPGGPKVGPFLSSLLAQRCVTGAGFGQNTAGNRQPFCVSVVLA